jgi:hypothetical protein
MATLSLFTDSGLTTPATLPLVFQQDDQGVVSPHQRNLWLGSNDVALKFQAASNPGVDQVQLQVNDTDSGSGQPASAIKLSLTQAGLASATGGAALNLGVQILSGVSGAKSIWVQFDDTTGIVATDTAVKLQTNLLAVSAV